MIILNKTELEKLKEDFCSIHSEFVKFVIDIRKEVIAVGMEMHRDLEIELYDNESNEKDLYGGNLYWNGKIDWQSHSNMKRNREKGQAFKGRVLDDEEIIVQLTDILNKWIWR